MKHWIICILFSLSFPLIGLTQYNCHRADTLMSDQNYISALTEWQACLQIDPENNDLKLKTALCAFYTGDYQLAKELYHQLEHFENYKAECISKLASIYESQQNLPKAIKYNIYLQQLYPGNPLYYRKLGSLYLQGNEPAQAWQSYQSAIKLNPRDLLALQGMAEMLLNADQLTVTDSLLNIGHSIDSTNIGISLLSARTKYRLRDYQHTAEILLRLSGMTELNNYYNKLLGYSLMQIDSLDKATYFLQKSLINENNPEYALYYLGIAYEKVKDFERSDYFYNEALKISVSENIGNYHKGIARINTNTLNFKKAIHHYTESLRYNEDAEIYFYLGNLSEQYYRDKSKAIKWYNKYLSSKAENKTFENQAKERVRLLKEKVFMKGSP